MVVDYLDFALCVKHVIKYRLVTRKWIEVKEAKSQFHSKKNSKQENCVENLLSAAFSEYFSVGLDNVVRKCD